MLLADSNKASTNCGSLLSGRQNPHNLKAIGETAQNNLVTCRNSVYELLCDFLCTAMKFWLLEEMLAHSDNVNNFKR